MKTCLKCGEVKGEDQMKLVRRKPSNICLACHSLYVKQWRAANPDKVMEGMKRWRAENPDYEANYREKKNARSRELRASNVEFYRDRDRKRYSTASGVARTLKWRKRNPEAFKAIDHAYRARKRAAPGRFRASDVQFLFSSQRGLCIVCEQRLRKGYCVDHVMPLALGGTNDKNNLQLLCRSCNAKKSKKHPVEFMQQIGRLL